MKSMILDTWLNQAIFRLCISRSARCDAEVILEKITGMKRSYFLGFGKTLLLTKKQIDQAEALLVRRIRGEPIAYLVGIREFWSLNLKIFSGIFIPRSDTECLVEQVLLQFSSRSSLKVLDLGTGTGAIALAIASERPNWDVTGVDCLVKIINLASENANLLKIKNVTFLLGNWFQNLKKNSYDLIVSNPPYLDINDPHLLSGDVRFEPKLALISKRKGLADLTYICHNANKYLKLGGWLILEHGWTQGKSVRQLFFESGFKCVTTVSDYGSNERITYGNLFKKLT